MCPFLRDVWSHNVMLGMGLLPCKIMLLWCILIGTVFCFMIWTVLGSIYQVGVQRILLGRLQWQIGSVQISMQGCAINVTRMSGVWQWNLVAWPLSACSWQQLGITLVNLMKDADHLWEVLWSPVTSCKVIVKSWSILVSLVKSC